MCANVKVLYGRPKSLSMQCNDDSSTNIKTRQGTASLIAYPPPSKFTAMHSELVGQERSGLYIHFHFHLNFFFLLMSELEGPRSNCLVRPILQRLWKKIRTKLCNHSLTMLWVKQPQLHRVLWQVYGLIKPVQPGNKSCLFCNSLQCRVLFELAPPLLMTLHKPKFCTTYSTL